MADTGTHARWRITGWASGGLINAIELGVSFGYLLFFLTQVLLLPPAMAGSILFAARLWDAVSDPLMGWLTDRTRPAIARRAWVLAGSLLLAFLYPLMFLVPPDLPLMHRAALFAGAYILANTASTIFAIPHLSLVSGLAPPEGRSRLMGWYLSWVRLGLVLVGLGAPLAFNLTDGLRPAFIAIGVASGALTGLIGVLVYRSAGPEAPSASPPPRVSPFASVGGALACPPLRQLALLQILKNAAVGSSASVLAFFITIVLEGPIELVGLVGTVASGLAALFTPLWVLAASRIDIRAILGLGLGLTAFCLACYLLLGPDCPATSLVLPVAGLALGGGLLAYVLIAMVNTVGDSAVNYAPTAMIPDANEWRRRQSGQDDSGSSFALFSLTGKLGFAAGGFISSLLLQAFGFVSGAATQSDAAMLGIRVAAGGVPALLLVACIPVALMFPRRQALLDGTAFGRPLAAAGKA